ncbi:MAG: hypothetical protein HFE52_02655 [Clostridia bacterium]|jgi:hypothetical protein|nr:hypothetical protein [Clostridia bacterium]MCI8979550.1 hypothetical protein [Clostridia bacterium]
MKIVNKVFGCMANQAEKAFSDAMGLASRSGGYEPEMSEEVKAYKANHTSKVEMLFNKLSK